MKKKISKKLEKRTAMLSVLLVVGLALAGIGTIAANGFSAGKAIPLVWMENGKVDRVVEAEPGVWKGKEAINEALTEGTENTTDDEGSEFVHEIQWEKIGMNSTSFNTAEETLEFVTEEILYNSDLENYGVEEAWANPEQTLKKGSGDCEDKAILLTSLLKFHTEEVNLEEDLIFVRIAPYQSELHAQVIWKDSQNWYLLDPTSGDMSQISSLSIGVYGTLWFNDETVEGWLSSYYEPQKEQPFYEGETPLLPGKIQEGRNMGGHNGGMQRQMLHNVWENYLNITRLEGVLEYNNGTYMVDTTVLYLGNEWFLDSLAKSDYDGDGTYEYVWQELEGLLGTTIVINGVLEDDILYASHINGIWFRTPNQADITELEGVLEYSNGSYFVDGTELVIEKRGYTKSDIDGDGALERTMEELDGLVGEEITVDGTVTDDGRILVVHINGIWIL